MEKGYKLRPVIHGRFFLAVSLLVLGYALGCTHTASALTPNDPMWSEQWALRQMNLPRAWDITTGSPGVVVATIDTGVDPTDGDLGGALVDAQDFITGGNTTEDALGHGTIVGTELVARGNNGIGIAGICWRCKLMPVRVAVAGDDFEPARVAGGIVWAVDHGARIVSLSFSDEGSSAETDIRVAKAIAYAADHDVLVLSSAGNTGTAVITHPASTAGAYAVAATDRFDNLPGWATRGSWIHLAAPGCYYLFNVFLTGPTCGTSTAAPAVAGVAALMLSVNRSLTPAQVVDALRSTAVPVAGIDGGRIDAFEALKAVGGKPAARSVPPARAVSRVAARARSPRMSTHVSRGYLGAGRVTAIDVLSGRVTATLRSAKARSCTLRLTSTSDNDVWVGTAFARKTVSLVARVPRGRYSVAVSCRVQRRLQYALFVRAIFA